MKNKTYRLMEQEQSLDKFDLLGLPPIDDLSYTTDDAIEILEKRLSDLREVYHQSKLELLHMEKRRRKRAEKKSK
uniref:Transcriptional regulator n=1 Tax=Angiostrongylus cantonensis TaxID=6313 RepID=A0A0K0DME0_ANGCA